MKLIQYSLCFLLVYFSLEARNPLPFNDSYPKGKDFSTRLTTPELQKQKITALYQNYWEFLMREFPEYATMVGYHSYNDCWQEHSFEALQRRKESYEAFEQLLKLIDRSSLSEEDQLNYDILELEFESKIRGTQFGDAYTPINAFSGVQIEIPQLLAFMPTKNIEQVRDILSRLRALPRLLSQVIHLLNSGLEKGITPPKIVLRDVPQQIASLITDDPKESALFLPFMQLSKDIPCEQRERLQKKAFCLLVDQVFPAFRELQEYLVNRYIPNCRESVSLSDLPDGAAWYQHKIATHTTTSLTPEEIHTIGLNEVKRIQAEIDTLLIEIGFEGKFDEFIERIHQDPRFFFDSTQELLSSYRDLVKGIEKRLPLLFGKLPSYPVEVIAVPPYSEASQIGAYYFPGSAEWGRPGYFFVNTYSPQTHPRWEMVALSLHEALPGHHLQVSLAQEMKQLSDFRKHHHVTAFVEGWGLYAESLGYDLGVYQDPYSRFGRLSFEIFRAARLVVDTGLHHLGWTRDQAIGYMRRTTGMGEKEVIREVDRYLVIPGQALAYKIGEMKIKEWRDLGKRVLGDRFDIRAFHDELLSYGSALSLKLLEEQMKRWITESAITIENSKVSEIGG